MGFLSSVNRGLKKYCLVIAKKLGILSEREFTKRYIRYLRETGVDILDYDVDSFIAETVDFDGYDRTRIHIGKNVYLTSGVIILVHDQSVVTVYNSVNREKDPGTMYAPGDVHIGNNVFIGMRSIVLPGTTIGDDVVIGAGSLVKGDIPSGTVWAGVPAKQICTTVQQYERLRARGLFNDALDEGRSCK